MYFKLINVESTIGSGKKRCLTMIQEAIKQEEERKKPQSKLMRSSGKKIKRLFLNVKNLVDEVTRRDKFGMKKILPVDSFHYEFFRVN